MTRPRHQLREKTACGTSAETRSACSRLDVPEAASVFAHLHADGGDTSLQFPLLDAAFGMASDADPVPRPELSLVANLPRPAPRLIIEDILWWPRKSRT